MSERTLNDRNRAIALLDVYEDLLTPAQKKIADAYFRFDLSFGEIAESESISRSAVSDCIGKAIAKMEELEEALRIIEVKEKNLARLKEIEQIEDKTKKLEAYIEFGKRYADGI